MLCRRKTVEALETEKSVGSATYCVSLGESPNLSELSSPSIKWIVVGANKIMQRFQKCTA